VIGGGKYTTYRVMGKDAVDAATRVLDGVPASRTEDIPLVGAVGYQARLNARETLAERAGLHVARVEHLLTRYGSAIDELLDLIAKEPGLGQPIEGAEDYLRVEARYAASHEGALHLDDILTRRTRISIETWDRGVAAAAPVARLVAPVLGWNDADIEREVQHYHGRVTAERESQEQADDHTADAARLGAPDVRLGAPTSDEARRTYRQRAVRALRRWHWQFRSPQPPCRLFRSGPADLVHEPHAPGAGGSLIDGDDVMLHCRLPRVHHDGSGT
jgi:glycerol-3-phosphate dehydrogenase